MLRFSTQLSSYSFMHCKSKHQRLAIKPRRSAVVAFRRSRRGRSGRSARSKQNINNYYNSHILRFELYEMVY